ncbi:hypothetical protein F4779DRAFT_591342 [Xylariaceae sp. FL0662B]|nr:hypothetical protein F4779DRAFT_591342 [Xylariaceae sp. FL0662B]
MVDRAAKLSSSMDSRMDDSRIASNFIFEMGFTPLLYFITTKCRCFTTRIQALSLVKKLGVCRENLWDMPTMYCAGRRIIEIEHGVLLNEPGQPATPVCWPGLPPDENRVRDSTTKPGLVKQIDAHGREIFGRAGGFIRRKPEGDIYLQSEFPCRNDVIIYIGNNRPHERSSYNRH